MKLKHKIIFSAVSSAIILSGAIAGSVATLATKNLEQTKTTKISQYNNLVVNSSNNKMANYQSRQYNILKNVPINRLNLLGSHDSGMYMTQERLGNDADGAPKVTF